MKKIIIMLLIMSVIISLGVLGVNAAGDITIKVDGKIIETDAKPFISNNRTMVPVRFVSEALGASVDWNPTYKVVTITKGTDKIVLVVGRKSTLANGVEKTLDAESSIAQGRTFVPLRFVSEILGTYVKWESSTRTVVIATKLELSDTEKKKIADRVRAIVELDMKQDWKPIFNYLSDKAKKTVTSPELVETKYDRLSFSIHNVIKRYNLDSYAIKCVIKEVSLTEVKVVMGVFSTKEGAINALNLTARLFRLGEDGEWYMDNDLLPIERELNIDRDIAI